MLLLVEGCYFTPIDKEPHDISSHNQSINKATISLYCTNCWSVLSYGVNVFDFDSVKYYIRDFNSDSDVAH